MLLWASNLWVFAVGSLLHDKDIDVFYENVEGAADVGFYLVFAVACDAFDLTLLF